MSKVGRLFAATILALGPVLIISDSAYASEGTMQATAGEWKTLQLTAPDGMIFTEIVWASFGNATEYGEYGTCHAENTVSVLEPLLGSSSFVVNPGASTDGGMKEIFGDPCHGTGKTLKVVLGYSADPTVEPEPAVSESPVIMIDESDIQSFQEQIDLAFSDYGNAMSSVESFDQEAWDAQVVFAQTTLDILYNKIDYNNIGVTTLEEAQQAYNDWSIEHYKLIDIVLGTSASEEPSDTPTESETVSPEVEPSPEPEPEPTPEPSPEPTPEETPEPTPVPSEDVVPAPTETTQPQPEPIPSPTPSPEPEPSPAPEEEPVVAPPTEEPQPQPEISDDPEPVDTPEPQPEIIAPEPEVEITPEEPSLSSPNLESEPVVEEPVSPVEPVSEPVMPISIPEVEPQETIEDILDNDTISIEQAAELVDMAHEVLETSEKGSEEYEEALEALALAATADDIELDEEIAAIPVVGAIAQGLVDIVNFADNVGADMAPETRETAEETVIAAVIVGQVAQVATSVSVSGGAYRRRIK